MLMGLSDRNSSSVDILPSRSVYIWVRLIKITTKVYHKKYSLGFQVCIEGDVRTIWK